MRKLGNILLSILMTIIVIIWYIPIVIIGLIIFYLAYCHKQVVNGLDALKMRSAIKESYNNKK